MDSGTPRNGFIRVSLAATAAILVLCAAWSTAAQGATNSVVRCNGDARDLTSLNVSSEALVANKVDHPSSQSDPTSLETVEAQSDAKNANAPLLYLTPRVANLLRDVFQISGQDSEQSDKDSTPSSPVADRVNNSSKVQDKIDEGDKISPAGRVDEEILPRFQQQMYRKDI